jgi:hypothetical protein
MGDLMRLRRARIERDMDVADPSGWKGLYPGIPQGCFKALPPGLKSDFWLAFIFKYEILGA